MKCIIVDDEKLARSLVESYAKKIPFLEIVSVCKNGIEALEVVKNNQIDLIITDIQMPGLLGTELIKSLSYKPKVIFTTAYEKYAIEGFELEEIDYLLKPFSFERFLKAVNKAESNSEKTKNESDTHFKEDYLTIKADHKLYKVQYKDIKYIEGMREYVSFHIPSGRITALLSLKSLEESLPKDLFIRCHKSFIINKTIVTALEGNNLIIEEKSIPIGLSYKDAVVKEVF